MSKHNEKKHKEKYWGTSIGFVLGLLVGSLFSQQFGVVTIAYGMLTGIIVGSLYDEIRRKKNK